jgi:peptidoglycan/xylan/chitin deacetylase (PgdA/CDA1 family)
MNEPCFRYLENLDWEYRTKNGSGYAPKCAMPLGKCDVGTASRKTGLAVTRRTKIVISLAFHLMAVTARMLRRVTGRPARHRLVILYYHTVPSTLRAHFARQLDLLATYATVVPADYQRPAVHGEHIVAITFDDALTSVLDNAIPELRARRMPATIFVPAGSLSGPPNWETDGAPLYGEEVATPDALRSATTDRLVQLGAHSLTHAHLTRVPKAEARREIAGCRELMRDMFGIHAHLFAFPYGDYDASILESCREAGYQFVFSIIPKVVDPTSEEFVRGRVSVDPADGPVEFYLKMSGAYAWMAHASALKRWLGTRLRLSVDR